MKLGGWSDKIYSRYAIAGERELGPALAQLGGLSEAQRLALWWQSGKKLSETAGF